MTGTSQQAGESQQLRSLHRAAQQHLARGEFDAAASSCRTILAEQPAHADALFLLGMAHLGRYRLQEAARPLAQAAQLAPQRADYQAQYAKVLSLANRHAEALGIAVRAEQLSDLDALSLDTLGNVHARANDHEHATTLFLSATAKQPGNAAYQFNLAASLKFIGRFTEAEAAYEACIASTPHYWRAHSALAQLSRWTAQKNHLDRLEKLLPEAQADADAFLHIHHALAKEYEDLGEHARAFRHLSIGKARKRSALNYTADSDAVLFRAMRSMCTPAWLNAPGGFGSAEPIFVVGMPRSGTTLVERILTSHPQVHSAGELQNFARAVKRAAKSTSPHLLDAQTIERAGRADMEALGQAYLASTRPWTGATPHFVDKMPLNFLYAGFIRRALPRAKIVCLRRDPLDTCLSNFRQLFALNFSYYNYAYDLLDTGRYYIEFERLIRHWQASLGEHYMEVHYEDIVDDMESQARRLLAFCSLDWDPACLDFHRNAAPVSTASAVQVRQPIYRSSIGRSRHYAEQLAPLRELLQAAGMIEPGRSSSSSS